MKSIVISFTPASEICLPFAHFEMLQGLVYRFLSYNNDFSTAIHNSENCKLFCFSDIQGKYRIENKTLVYREPVSIEIRSFDDGLIDVIAQNLFEHREQSLNNCPFTVSKISFANAPLFDTKTYSFSASTPITVYKTDENFGRIFFSPTDGTFEDLVKINLLKKYESAFGKEYDGLLEFHCDDYTAKNKCVTRFKKTWVNGWYGKYTLVAEKDMLTLAYYTGLGAKNSAGFGFIR